MSDAAQKKTPLYDEHVRLGARMVPFGKTLTLRRPSLDRIRIAIGFPDAWEALRALLMRSVTMSGGGRAQ